MTADELAAALTARELRPSPGVLVALDLQGRLTICVAASFPAPVVDHVDDLDELLEHRLLAPTASSRPSASPPGLTIHDWNDGWPLASGTVLLQTLEEALILAENTPVDERRLLTLRFLASVAPQVGAILIRAVRGSMRLIDFTPTEASARLVATTPIPQNTTALLPRDQDRWHLYDPNAISGPLSPAIALSSSRHGRQFIATTAVLPSPAGIGRPLMTAAGVRESSAEAELVAAAEATERYAAGVIHGPDLRVGSFNDLEDAVHPDRFVAFLDWQRELFPELRAFDEDAERVWVSATSRQDHDRCCLLADLVFYPFGDAHSLRHVGCTSSGVAAHMTVTQATRSAWAELVERDAFMRHWLGRRPGRSVRFPAPPVEYAQMRADVERRGWDVRLLQLGKSPDHPVLCAFATREDGVILGAGAGDPAAAAVSALREVWSAVGAERGELLSVEPHDVRTPSEHRRLYQCGGLGSEVAFLAECDEEIDIATLLPLRDPPSRCVRYVWPSRITRPFRVARVLDPDLIPITFGYQREPLGRPDVAAILQERGASGRNMLPHPFG